MTRVVVVVVVLCAVGGWLYWLGGKEARYTNRETTIHNEREIRDAIADCADLHWTERLRCN